MTELVFILDRSGSMHGLEADTIGGFNAMLSEQKAKGDALVTTVLFDDEQTWLYSRRHISKVAPLSAKEYFARGSTALLDAIGDVISYLRTLYRELPPKALPEQTVIVITTDGLENSSRRYDARLIRQMITTQKEEYGWEFIFLGANIDAVREGGNLGIDQDRIASYCADSRGIELNFNAIGNFIDAARSAEPIGTEWKAEVEEDHRKRK